MRSVVCVLFFVLILPFQSISQSIDLVWPLGYGVNPMANLNFTSGTMVVDTDYHIMQLRSTNSSIADSSGNLIMYSNGCFIANVLDDTMANGDNLNPDTCTITHCGYGNIITQGNLILPDPGSDEFYLFHETCNYSNNLNPIVLYYSSINLSLDSGRGAVLNKNTVLYSGLLCDGILTAVKHADGLSWWVLLHKRNSDEFVQFLVTPVGIQGPFFQSIGPVFSDVSKGNSKFSPDGKKFVTTTEGSNMHIFDFNRCTGLLSNYEFIANPVPSTVIAFIEFSSSSRYLFYLLSHFIYQYDILASNIAGSATIAATYDGFVDVQQPTVFGPAQLAKDKKIYILAGATNYLHVINTPDSIGALANVTQHSILLPCKNVFSIPNLPNYHLGALSPAYCDSINTVKEIISKNIKLSPNPCTDFLKVNFNQSIYGISLLKIYSSLGQLFLQLKVIPNSMELTVDVSRLPSGVYFITVEGDYPIARRGFVKQ